MTTLADITLRVAKEITDVLNGTASVGAGAGVNVTSITDATNLKQSAGHWEGGTLWFRSGTGVTGKVVTVDSFALTVLHFASIGVVNPAVNANYSVADKKYPWAELVKAVNSALEEDAAKIRSTDSSLTGDGTTVEFTLPTGVSNVKTVEFEDTNGDRTPCHHGPDEIGGKIRFPSAPQNGNKLVLHSRIKHSVLSLYSDAIDSDINEDWLLWKSVEKIMLWALNMYADSPEKGLATKLQYALQQLQGRRAVWSVDVMIQTA